MKTAAISTWINCLIDVWLNEYDTINNHIIPISCCDAPVGPSVERVWLSCLCCIDCSNSGHLGLVPCSYLKPLLLSVCPLLSPTGTRFRCSMLWVSSVASLCALQHSHTHTCMQSSPCIYTTDTTDVHTSCFTYFALWFIWIVCLNKHILLTIDMVCLPLCCGLLSQVITALMHI